MRALFITNQRKTEFYDRVAQGMREGGIEIFWISLSPRWTRFLIAQGWKASAILDLSKRGKEWSREVEPSEADWAWAARIEAGAKVTLKSILLMDRELSRRPGAAGERYIHVVGRAIEGFVVENEIEVAFGEDTWAPEILTYAIMRALGRRYYVPHIIRIPAGLFGFFNSVFHDELETKGTVTGEHRALAMQTIKDVREKGLRPFYFARNQSPNRLRRHWMDEALLGFRISDARYDHTVPRLSVRAGRRLRSSLRERYTRAAGILKPALADPPRPYVLFPLTKQPESSIDVYGQALNNQFELIRALARILPSRWEIWVKEHPHAVGDRSPADYRAMARMPGVRLIHYNEDTMTLIRGAGLVVSVSGTASMEAGILRVPAATVAPMFFGKLLLRNGFNPYVLRSAEMADMLEEARIFREDAARDDLICDALSEIIARSYPGLVSDPISAPECMEGDNVHRVVEACMSILSQANPAAGVAGEPPYGNA